MKVTIVNGSPRGENSITLQTSLYLQKKFPSHKYTILNAGATIHSLEKDFTPALKAIKSADLVIFSYPVYTFTVPSQMHCFIELLKKQDISFSTKVATQISTSKHFYDICAHRFMEENFFDMGFKVVEGLSADSGDLLTDKGQKEASDFFSHLLFSIENKNFMEKPSKCIAHTQAKFRAITPKGVKIPGYDIVIVADMDAKDTNLQNLISNFQNELKFTTKIINIADFEFKGGCLGCLNCVIDGKCIYKDGFDSFFRENIQNADAIIYAGKVQDHSLGLRFKMFDDRQFCNGHRTVTSGIPIAYLLTGDIMAESNLRMVLEGKAQVGHNYLAGFAYDKYSLSKVVDNITFALENRYVPPQNFLGIGGMKIFRDLVYTMQGFLKEDHKFYKKNGFYDFPQKDKKTIFMSKLLGFLLKNKKIQKQAKSKMNDAMLEPYKKIIDSVEITVK